MALTVSLIGNPAQAQGQPGTPTSDTPVVSTIIARDVIVTGGESLRSIAARELGKAGFAAQLADFNAIPLDAPLAAGSVIRIPIMVAARAQFAQVVFVKGDVTLRRALSTATVVSAQGNTAVATLIDIDRDTEVYSGDTILTSSDGYISIEFSSGSVVNMQPDTEATLSQLNCLPDTDSCLIEIDTPRGKLTSDVNKRDDQAIDFRISTPYASAAVRGTVFDVEAGESLKVGVTEGAVGLNAQQQDVALDTGFGSVVEAGQTPSAPVPLLPAPVFKRIPTRMAPGDAIVWWPFDDAASYNAQLANDEAGVETLASFETAQEQLNIDTAEPGDYYLLMRAVDNNGLRGFTSNTRLTIARIDDTIAPVNTNITRQGREFLVEVQQPSGDDVTGYEIQISDNQAFDDPLSVDVNASGRAVFRVNDDQVFTRARVLIDPYTVSAFGDISGSDD